MKTITIWSNKDNNLFLKITTEISSLNEQISIKITVYTILDNTGLIMSQGSNTLYQGDNLSEAIDIFNNNL